MSPPGQSCSQNIPWSDALPIEEEAAPADPWLAPEDGDGLEADGTGPAEATAQHDEALSERLPRNPPARPATNEELAALLGRVMRQDEAALSDLYLRMSGAVYAVALRCTRRVDLAEEVLQDTFWQIWRQAPRFDPERGSAAAWVMIIARSRAMDALRALHRSQARTAPVSAADSVELCQDYAPDPFDLLGNVQRDSLLHKALSALDPLKRQLVGLAFYRGLTHEEIALQTGIPLGTVKSHLRRTLAALKQVLGTDECIEDLGRIA